MKILIPLCLTGFVGYLNLFGLTPFVPEIAADLDITVSMVGASITGSWLVSAAAGLVIGPIASQYGQRRTIIAGLLCIAVSAAGTAAAANLAVLLGSRIVGGVGASVAAGVTLAVAADHFQGDGRRRALSIVSAAMAIAVMAGLLMLTTVSSFTGWRGALATLAVVSAATAVLARVLLPPDRRSIASVLHLTGIVGSYRAMLRGSPVLWLIVACFLHGVTLTGLTTYLGAFMSSEHGLSTQHVGLVMSLLGTGYFAGTIVAGSGFRQLNLRGVFGLVATASALCWIVVFSAVIGVPETVVALGMAAITAGIGWVCLVTLIAENAGRNTTVIMVLGASILSFGSAFGSGLGGVILSLAGYQALGIGLAFFVLVAAPLVWRKQSALAA